MASSSANPEIDSARALAAGGDTEAAVAALGKLIQQDSGNVDAWLALADIVGDPARAKQCLDKVLSLDPGNAIAQQMLVDMAPKKVSVGMFGTAPTQEQEPDDDPPVHPEVLARIDGAVDRVQPIAEPAEVEDTVPEAVEPAYERDEAEPAGIEPVYEPVETEPAGIEPVYAPVEAEPAGVEPVYEPVETEPAGIEPVNVPVEAEPAGIEPVNVPVEAEPAGIEPVYVPVEAEPAGDEPSTEEPPTEPESTYPPEPDQPAKSRRSYGRIDVLLVGLTGIVGLVLCGLVGRAVLSNSPIFSSEPTETPDEVVQVVFDNIIAANREDINAYMGTIHPNSPGYSQTQLALQEAFTVYDLSYEISIPEMLDQSNSEAIVTFILTTRRVGGPAFRDNTVTGQMTLRKHEGLWKIYDQQVQNIEYLN